MQVFEGTIRLVHVLALDNLQPTDSFLKSTVLDVVNGLIRNRIHAARAAGGYVGLEDCKLGPCSCSRVRTRGGGGASESIGLGAVQKKTK